MSEIQDYWKSKRLNYDDVLFSHIKEQTAYMADVAGDNARQCKDKNSEEYHYWAAFSDIVGEFNSLAASEHVGEFALGKNRIKGMLDAMNVICNGVSKGDFSIGERS